MAITNIVPQLRTTDINTSIRWYTEKLGFEVEFNFEDFYAGLRIGTQKIHLKLVDEKDPSIDFVREGGHLHLYLETKNVADFAEEVRAKGVSFVRDVHETPWDTRELVIEDDQGHTLYFGEPI